VYATVSYTVQFTETTHYRPGASPSIYTLPSNSATSSWATRAAYNSIERGFGILEQHWNGALLDSVEAVIQYASTMTWKGKHPVVALVTTTYQTGVNLTKEALDLVEGR
jgi:hypothetical protein